MPSDIRLGLWGARADNTGLATQTQMYFEHLKPSKTMLVDLSSINQSKGKDTPFYAGRFPGADMYPGFPNNRAVDEFLDDLDVVLAVETPYTYYLFEAARERGIATILNYNYEFLDYLAHPQWAKPDWLLAPSMWKYDEAEELAHALGMHIMMLPVPVDRSKLPFVQRHEARRFLHIAGHPTYLDRNGTNTVVESLQYIESKDIEITIRSQHPLPPSNDPRLRIDYGDATHYYENFRGEDVLLLPRKYGGLSLQLNEAMSTGMIPLMTDCEPQRQFLHKATLMLPDKIISAHTRTTFEAFEVSPQILAEYIDLLHRQTSPSIENLSDHSNRIARAIDWDSMQVVYETFIESVHDRKQGR